MVGYRCGGSRHDARAKIGDLLSCHAIFMADSRTMALFVLSNEKDEIEWTTFEGDESP
jgi:hypothetical protein